MYSTTRKEVAIIAGMLAAEVGADREIAKRGALLHDIGKGIETDGDANHAELGMELARKNGEDHRVINANRLAPQRHRAEQRRVDFWYRLPMQSPPHGPEHGGRR